MGSSIIPILITEQPHYQSVLKKKLYFSIYAFIISLVLVHVYINPFSFKLNNRSIAKSPPSSFNSSSSPSQDDHQILTKTRKLQTSCDYSIGEWVPNDSGPLYDDTTCETIKHGRNCVAYGRPDGDYLHWKWQPENCKLPNFQPVTFLELLENKHIAFVGDSLARNQLESLICMMSTMSKPELFYREGEDDKFRKWRFSSHNITVSVYWSPFLVKGIERNGVKIGDNVNTMFLDRIDEKWAKDLKGFDILVLSVGHWYLNPTVYYYGDKVLGCHFCGKYEEIGFYDVFGTALNTTFQEILIQGKIRPGKTPSPGKIPNRGKKPISVFLTTFSPAHFEGEWDKLGSCSRTRPYSQNETNTAGLRIVGDEMRKIEFRELDEARLRVKEHGNNVRLEALDITEMAFMRPDGHPGPYMNPNPFANGVPERVQNDCVHWCLPGPIDTWNEVLMDVIKRWDDESKRQR